MSQKNTDAWTFDVRVRERNLKSGQVSEKDIDAYLTGLPDLAAHVEPFGLAQPALDGDDADDADDESAASVHAAPVAVAPAPVVAPEASAVAPISSEPGGSVPGAPSDPEA